MPTVFQSVVVNCNGTVPPTNPTITSLGFVGGLVRVIRIVIPDGHAGLTGIALGYGSNNVVPSGLQAYYSGNDREIVLDYVDAQPGVTWQAVMCNNDTIPHGWEVNFDLDTFAAVNQSVAVTPLTPSAILAAGTSATNGP